MDMILTPELVDIRAQVEFYFGLENLLQDAFLLSRMNSRMMVPLSLIFSFKKVRQLSSGFDSLLAAVKQSPSKLVVEFDSGEWWIGPNPQSRPDSPCTIILTDVHDDVTVDHIEALTSIPLLHSYNFADGTWHATYQDSHAAGGALAEMQRKKLKGVPVRARLKSDTLPSSDATQLNRNAAPYQLPTRFPRTPNNTPDAPPHASLGGARPSPVAGCRLFVSRNPMAAHRQMGAGVSNALYSSFSSMSPAQQQMVMMNFMVMQQQLMAYHGARPDDSYVPSPLVNGHARPSAKQRRPDGATQQAVDCRVAPIGDGIDDAETRRKLSSGMKNKKSAPSSLPAAQGSLRMEALGADLPDVRHDGRTEDSAIAKDSEEVPRDADPSHTQSGTGKIKRHDRKEAHSDRPLPALDPIRYPALGQEGVVQKEAPLSGWAAAIAKAPVPKAARDAPSDEVPKRRKTFAPVTKVHSVASVEGKSPAAPIAVESPSVSRSYASLLKNAPAL